MLKKAELKYLEIDKNFQLTDDEVDNIIYNTKWGYPVSRSRGIYNMGKNYDFFNIRVVGHEFDAAVFRLMTAINEKYGFNLNSCLLNYYEDGKVMLGHHSDNYNMLQGGGNAIVVSVSYYESRDMEFLSKDHKEKLKITLHHGDVLLMGAGCQRHYTHAIVKDAKKCGHRLNLTFREFIG